MVSEENNLETSSTNEMPVSHRLSDHMKQHRTFTITREIGIDAGHRVTNHHSKCRSLHGHRYKVELTCIGALAQEGSQEGMVLDFGFMKDAMMDVVDAYCDHAMILWSRDPLIKSLFERYDEVDSEAHDESPYDGVIREVEQNGYAAFQDPEDTLFGKLYILNCVPTAENLARHWYTRLQPVIEELSEGRASVHKIEVWETPNCKATYPLI